MYLASFRYRDRDALGARVSDTHLIDLAEAAKVYGNAATPAAAFSDMHAFIEAGPAAQRQAERLLSVYRNAPDKVAAIPLTEISWHPPVRRPGKICCIALNNSASDSRRISGPNHPMFFLKPRSCLVGHEQDIVVRPHYGGLHPEPELAVVVGRTAKDLDPRSALDAVFGYSIINDITGNEMRAQDRVHYYALYASKENPDQVERREQHLSYTARYKGSDTFGPMGPWLVTRDEVPDPHALDVTCSVAGILLAEDSTRYLTYSVPEYLALPHAGGGRRHRHGHGVPPQRTIDALAAYRRSEPYGRTRGSDDHGTWHPAQWRASSC